MAERTHRLTNPHRTLPRMPLRANFCVSGTRNNVAQSLTTRHQSFPGRVASRRRAPRRCAVHSFHSLRHNSLQPEIKALSMTCGSHRSGKNENAHTRKRFPHLAHTGARETSLASVSDARREAREVGDSSHRYVRLCVLSRARRDMA